MQHDLVRAAAVVALVGLCLASGCVTASGLQVAPVSLSLLPSQNADGLWLSNTGSNVVHAQIRVYHWTQENGQDVLTPSRGLVISPPMLQLAVGERQLIRVIRVGAPPNGAHAVEDAYRIAIDELPVENKGTKGLQFVLHYSVPVFVEPVGATAAPQLQWTTLTEGAQASLEVANQGTGHAQLAALNYIDAAGTRTELAAGLLGYVLPGMSVRWPLKTPATSLRGGGTFEALVNGAKATQTVSLADRPR